MSHVRASQIQSDSSVPLELATLAQTVQVIKR